MRWPDLRRTVTSRVRHLAGATVEENPTYELALLSALFQGIELGIEALEKGTEWPMLIPAAICHEAQHSAQTKISLDTVLRCHIAASRSLEEFVMAEAAVEAVPVQMLNQILTEQGAYFDRLIEIVAKEYEDELSRLRRPLAQQQADRIIDLVRSESPIIPVDVHYDFEGWHVGLIVMGGDNPGATARDLAGKSDHRALHVAFDHQTAWVWLSSSHRQPLTRLERLLKEEIPASVSVGMGEPRSSLDGWRLTHREAEMTQRVMAHRPTGLLVRSKDIILLAGILVDETLARALLITYLSPLTAYGEGGKALLGTLRTYFSKGGNAAATATSLGVTRHTVRRRIRTIEQALGQPLHACQPELQVALRVEEVLKGT